MAIDVAQLIEDMKKMASQVLNKDVTTLRGFSERQLKAIAQQAAFVEAEILSGEITDETRDFFEAIRIISPTHQIRYNEDDFDPGMERV